MLRGAWVDATWSVGRCNVEHEAMLRAGWIDAICWVGLNGVPGELGAVCGGGYFCLKVGVGDFVWSWDEWGGEIRGGMGG